MTLIRETSKHWKSEGGRRPPAPPSLWDQAYDALAKQMPDLVRKYDELLAAEEQMANSASNETTHLRSSAPHSLNPHSDISPRRVQLNTVIQHGLQRMEDNNVAYKIGDREFVLADQITQDSNFLLWGKDLIGSGVKISPKASLAWSAVCLVLPLLANPTTAAEANRDGFVYVTCHMRYYVALEPLLRRLGQNTSVSSSLMSVANDHIVDLYQAVLQFLLGSVLRFYQSRFETYVHDIVPSKDWEQTRLDIEKLEGTVDDDLIQINGLVARQALEYLNKTSGRIRATMENRISVATQHLPVSKQQQAAQEDAEQERFLAKQQECLRELYLTQNGKGAAYDWYKGRVETRVEGTCRWFLQHEHFQKWLLQESGLLLVTADPGCGKSVLAKYLIDHGMAQQSATICYFFFTDHDQNTIRQALCALLHQLFSQKLALIQHAMELYSRMGADLVDSELSLWALLRDALRDPQAGPVIFVIDALDECDGSQLRDLITYLANMFRDQQLASAKFKVLMTSRPYQRAVSEFDSLQAAFQHIHIPGEEEFNAISQEINCVIHHRVEQLAQEHRLSDKVKSTLNKKLLTFNHRTYLWVHLIFDYLENDGYKTTDDGIDAAIQTLPRTVNEAYNRILNRSLGEKTVETITKALSIMLAAPRPLTLSEMNIALSLDEQGRGRSIYDLDLEQDGDLKTHLRALCGLFVNVHHDKIYFFHQTAWEFLIRSSAPTTVSSDLQWHHSITDRHAHSALAEICMLYLDRLNSTGSETFSEDDHHGALLQYSVEHWGDHCRKADFKKGSAMVDLAAGLCTPDLTCNSQWARAFSKRYHIGHVSVSATNVLVASEFGLTPVTELLLRRGADIEAKNDHGWTALILAANFGHEAVTRRLLEKGADVEAKTDDGLTALMHSAGSGHEAVTRLLLKNGADVEEKDDHGWTALMHSARSGDEAVTRLLIRRGADVEAKDDHCRTALILAADSGHEHITRLLLERGANVQAKKHDGWTALMLAAGSGHEDVTRLLIERGADVEAPNDHGWTALMLASEEGDKAVTRLLLDNRADVEAKDDDGRTALMIAARRGHEAVTRLLIERGANVDAKKYDGWTVLMLAASSGHEDVTRLLIERGANVEAKDDDGRTALMIAARRGHEAVTRLLIERGANVDAKKYDGWTVLMLAASSGHEDVTRLLIERGANVEAKDDHGWTVLMLAAENGDEAFARLLLENGANIEAKDDHDRTALILAADSGHETITRLLIEKGADIEAKDDYGWTALLVAARNGHEAVTRFLLDKGAGVEAKQADGATALLIAARYGHEDVTRLLVEKGADVEAKDDDGWTALMIAARYGHKTVTRLLLENGAGVEAKQADGATALLLAARYGHEDVTRLLVEKGADVEAKDDDGWTALMIAARYGHKTVTRLLLEKGAGVEAKEADGWTALMIAAKYGHKTVTRMLLENGTDVEARNNDGRTALMIATRVGYEAVARLLR